ncbi:TniB family NTP-binding protein [Rhizobium sp. BK008]|uniref:TniB family NTP-binding protein n=1 Tax=Rhizobium sp. BK008 TaxID=2587094 RepID=UPI00160AEC85|nr:TniB family NTP-binding protein [Rhizobium sp. BK008]
MNISVSAPRKGVADTIAAAASTRFHTEAFETQEQRDAASKLPKTDRQRMVENLLVKYAVFNTGLQIIKSNHMPVNGGQHAKGTVGAMLGASRTGKSSVCEYYAAAYPPTLDDEGELFPVVHLQASVQMMPTEFAKKINELTVNRHPARGGVGTFVDDALLQLLRVKTQLLIIDDAQDLFFGRTELSAASMYKLVKTILDFKTLAVLLVGDSKIDDFVNGIDAFANRGYNSVPLAPLSGGKDDMKRFAGLLRSIDKRLPFQNLSGLDDPTIVEDLFRYSEGMVGRVMNLIRPAAFIAFNAGTSHILIEHLREAVSTRMRKGDTFKYFGFGSDAA